MNHPDTNINIPPEAWTTIAASLAGATKRPKITGPIRAGRKIGRNAPCPCGSGDKYKRCCGSPAGGAT